MRVRGIGFAALAILSLSGGTLADRVGIEPGYYAISYRLELPHLERYAVEREVYRCVDSATETGPPLPVFGARNAFDGCTVVESGGDQAVFHYAIQCQGRAGARARGAYSLTSAGYSGRVAITLGAKNMTLVEVQSAERLGQCE